MPVAREIISNAIEDSSDVKCNLAKPRQREIVNLSDSMSVVVASAPRP